jgi:cell division inhibitor SepF
MGDKFIDKLKFFWGVDSREDEQLLNDDFYNEMKRTDLEAEETVNAIAETTQKSINTIKTSNKILNIHTNAQMNVVLYQPRSFEETTAIVDTLKSKRPVIMNILDLDKDLARKIFDFCSGALYALDGHINLVSKGIYVLAPPNVDVTGDTAVTRLESQMNDWLKSDD